MTRVRQPSPPSVKSTGEASPVSTSSSSSSASEVKKTKSEEVQQQPSLPEHKKTQRKHEKKMSGEMKKAAFEKSFKEKPAVSKTQSPSTTAAQAPSTPATQSATAAASVASAKSTATTPVQVNVLAHTPAGGSLKTIGDSPQDRLKFFDQMCAKASAGIPASKSGEQQMNVMVAPEWLFAKRSDPNNRAYTGKDMQDITEGLQQISKKYPGMLMVPGSVSWEIPDKADPKKTIMYNTTPVVQDGKIIHMYHKRLEGGETGKELDRWGMGRPEISSKVESFNTAFFEHKGVNFSLEMCADQAGAMSRKEYLSKFPNGKGTDVHIFISEGSQLQPSMAPVKNGGLVVHVDGSGPGASKVGVVKRDDVTLAEWMDNRTKVDAQFATGTGLTGSGAVEPQSERMTLFSGLTVKVPKKDS